jgi:Domain of unknown function (DUF4262)
LENPVQNWNIPEAEDDSDRKLLADIASHGWHIVGVNADEGGPGFAFSVGLYYTLGHPEVLIMGLPHPISACLINDLGDAIRSGDKFEAGSRYGDIAAGFPLALLSMDQRYFREYLGYALWFYRTLDFPVLQCVWPDKLGIFPWETGYDSRFFDMQRVLGKPVKP